MKTQYAHWSLWWKSLRLWQKILPAACTAAIWGGYALLGGFRSDHWAIGLAILGLGYLGPRTRKVLAFIRPLFLTAIVYDSQRYYSDLIRGRIRVEEPYLFDKTYFGIPTQQGVLTPNEWWQLHTAPILDLITGFYYLTFIGIFVLISAYFVFWLSKRGTSKLTALDLTRQAPRLMWSFFWVNIIGYSTYYWYPAAPPWYVALHGLGAADLSVGPNPAGCARFDELLGTHFFAGMYGRSADVFGAIPSLHVAYPLIAVWYAFKFGSARVFALSFYAIMCFSAVYLNHHYVLDILWGSAYALIICYVLDGIADWIHAKNSAKSQTESETDSDPAAFPAV